jgi:hypothetical protein
MPKITRIKLDDQSDEEYSILGIVSTEADYKISHLLNTKLKLSLKNNKTLDIPGARGANLSFSRYSCSAGTPEITYSLISNRSGKNWLLKTFKNIDYILLVYCGEDKCNVDHLTKTLREIEKITAVFNLNPLEIKDKNLVYLTP